MVSDQHPDRERLLQVLAAQPSRSVLAAAVADLERAIAHDEPLTVFLRRYLRPSLLRVADNIVRLRAAGALGARMLDVGSLGVEPVFVRWSQRDADVSAVSFEGDRIHYDGGRLSRAVLAGAVEQFVQQVDVEGAALPFADGSFDVVSCFETIEHLHRTPLSLLDEIRRVLRPGGLLLLTTPNVVGTRAVARALCGRHPQENPRYHRSASYGVVHPKEYTPHELAALCTARGLAPLRLTTEYHRDVTIAEWAFGVCLATLRRVAGRRFLPSGPGDNCVVIAGRSEPAAELPAAVFD